jgi:hypothetical protein
MVPKHPETSNKMIESKQKSQMQSKNKNEQESQKKKTCHLGEGYSQVLKDPV